MLVRSFAFFSVLVVFASAGAVAEAGPESDDATPARSPLVRFADRRAGLSVSYPRGWHRRRPLTRIIYPRERLALASYPIPRNDTIGECQAQHSLERMPPDGAFVYLLEYRPLRGNVWADLKRRDFPPRPRHFRLRLTPNISCYQGPAEDILFRDAGRPFDLFVALGPRASAQRIAEVEAILDSLRFRRLSPPPPDPYAGWKLLTTESGDSLRPPPGWPAAATFKPRELPRPRPLFFAGNLPLAGLPQRFTASVQELPSPFPAQALDGSPDVGVLLWVLEEPKGGASADFPRISRGWPAGAFQPATNGPAQQWPSLTWLRAGGTFRGYRFSIWIAAGPEASESDRALAVKSAASLAISGCLRDNSIHCPGGP